MTYKHPFLHSNMGEQLLLLLWLLFWLAEFIFYLLVSCTVAGSLGRRPRLPRGQDYYRSIIFIIFLKVSHFQNEMKCNGKMKSVCHLQLKSDCLLYGNETKMKHTRDEMKRERDTVDVAMMKQI